MISQRQSDILKIFINLYIELITPISSKLLLQKSSLQLSSATIRNEFVELEKMGFIYQPHTSAGRIPTQAGYEFYVENFLSQKKVKENFVRDYQNLKEALLKESFDVNHVKRIAKIISKHSKALAFIAFDENSTYYTGLSHFFAQPEFQNPELIVNLSQMIDHFDDVILHSCRNIHSMHTFLGENNPFSKYCSTIIRPFKSNSSSLIGLIGPMRMDYSYNYSLLDYIDL